jgi:hypothetical protein
MTSIINIGFVVISALIGLTGGALVGSLFGLGFVGALAGAGYSIGWSISQIINDQKPSEC